MDIDFVIIWVDGSDEEWLKEKEKFSPKKNTDSRNNRYRDLDNLQYWFRGVEKFAPWVRKIHFVTWGHLPDWLNKNNPKLNIVKHSDYIPNDYLPTFSSHPIELNLHRIKGLSDNFVYFNDDMYIVKEMRKEDFFINNLPCDNAILDAISPTELFSHILVNNIEVVNRHFHKRDTIKENFKKWFNFKYGIELYRTLALLPWGQFTGIKNPHLPIAFKKKTYFELWEKENETLSQTCLNKYRNASDINAWLLRYWQLLKGEFYPAKLNGKHYDIENIKDIENVVNGFNNPKYKMLCLNDSVNENDFEEVKKQLKTCFNKILPDKSSFET